jgi:hypothetical protein
VNQFKRPVKRRLGLEIGCQNHLAILIKLG